MKNVCCPCVCEFTNWLLKTRATHDEQQKKINAMEKYGPHFAPINRYEWYTFWQIAIDKCGARHIITYPNRSFPLFLYLSLSFSFNLFCCQRLYSIHTHIYGHFVGTHLVDDWFPIEFVVEGSTRRTHIQKTSFARPRSQPTPTAHIRHNSTVFECAKQQTENFSILLHQHQP